MTAFCRISTRSRLAGEWEMKEMKITLYKGRMDGACDLTDEDDGLEVHSTDKVDGDSLIRKGESMMKQRQSRAANTSLWTWSFSFGVSDKFLLTATQYEHHHQMSASHDGVVQMTASPCCFFPG